MKAFIILAHPEPQSFNAAMFRTAADVLVKAGHEVKTSDLCAMHFDPVSGRHNFTTIKDPKYLKLQMEEMYASEAKGFAGDIENEIQKIEWCDLMIWQFPLWWFGMPGILKGWVDRVFAMGRTLWRRQDVWYRCFWGEARTAVTNHGWPTFSICQRRVPG